MRRSGGRPGAGARLAEGLRAAGGGPAIIFVAIDNYHNYIVVIIDYCCYCYYLLLLLLLLTFILILLVVTSEDVLSALQEVYLLRASYCSELAAAKLDASRLAAPVIARFSALIREAEAAEGEGRELEARLGGLGARLRGRASDEEAALERMEERLAPLESQRSEFESEAASAAEALRATAARASRGRAEEARRQVRRAALARGASLERESVAAGRARQSAAAAASGSLWRLAGSLAAGAARGQACSALGELRALAPEALSLP